MEKWTAGRAAIEVVPNREDYRTHEKNADQYAVSVFKDFICAPSRVPLPASSLDIGPWLRHTSKNQHRGAVSDKIML
jgi:hypothetical protein